MSEPDLLLGETPVTREIQAHLDALGIPYERIEHPPVTTSEHAAAVRGTGLSEGAKALIVKADDRFYHLVISAAARLDNAKLRGLVGTRRVRFATREELWELTGCRPGAVPPLGNLFGLPVLMDESLLAEEIVSFNAGSHTVSLRMRREDLQRAMEARVVCMRET